MGLIETIMDSMPQVLFLVDKLLTCWPCEQNKNLPALQGTYALMKSWHAISNVFADVHQEASMPCMIDIAREARPYSLSAWTSH